MPGREKVSFYMIFFIMTFGTIGLISFQTLKERKNSSILLVAKYKEIDNLKNQYEELLEATKKTLLQAKEEKEILIHKIKDLEKNSKTSHDKCEEDKEKFRITKNNEITTLKEILQAKDIELRNTNAKIELFNFKNKEADGNTITRTIGKDDMVEGIESIVKTLDNKDKNLKNALSPKPTKEEKINDGQSFIDESNVVIQAKVENSNAQANFGDDQINREDFEENEVTSTKVEEDDDAKELEADMKLSDFDGGDTNESQLQE